MGHKDVKFSNLGDCETFVMCLDHCGLKHFQENFFTNSHVIIIMIIIIILLQRSYFNS